MCEGLGLVFMGTKHNPSVELWSGAIIIYVQQCDSEFSVVLDGQVVDGVFVGKIIYILECYALRGRSHLQGVCHIAALPFTLKSILMPKKKKLWKLKYFTMQKYNLQKNPLKETQILQDIYYNSIITNLKFQYKPKISSFKNPHIKIDLLLPRVQNPISY